MRVSVQLDVEDTTVLSPASLSGNAIDGTTGIDVTVFLVGGNAGQKLELGDDGDYTIEGLPTGDVQIGVVEPCGS